MGPVRPGTSLSALPCSPHLGDLLGDVLGPLHHFVGCDDLNLCGGTRAVLLQVKLHEVECELRDLADGPVLDPARARPLCTRPAVRAL